MGNWLQDSVVFIGVFYGEFYGEFVIIEGVKGGSSHRSLLIASKFYRTEYLRSWMRERGSLTFLIYYREVKDKLGRS